MLTFTSMFGGNVCYRRINPSKSLASGPGKNGDADVRNLESAQSRVHIDQFVSAFRTVEGPVFFCLRSSCKHTRWEGRKYCEACTESCHEYDGDFVDALHL
jgi:hypothetical protein